MAQVKFVEPEETYDPKLMREVDFSNLDKLDPALEEEYELYS